MGDGVRLRGRLLRLAVEIAQERAVAERLCGEILTDAERLQRSTERQAPPQDDLRGAVAVLAVGLHRWYTAIESIVERAERFFGTMPAGPEWHMELLAGAVVEIPDVRPAILPPTCHDELRNLAKFRHFFRHAYAVELDGTRLLALAADLRAVAEPVMAAIRTMESFLKSASRALSEAG